MIPKQKIEFLCDKYSETVPEYANKNLFYEGIKVLSYLGFVSLQVRRIRELPERRLAGPRFHKSTWNL